jgi:sugar-phosphate isomerases, RpiB/LacA/LacB family
MPNDQLTKRERVQNLVREILSRFPQDAGTPHIDTQPEHVVVNSMKAKVGREFDRDESAKSLITEDELRGLEAGSRLRIARSARFTPLASDLITDREIELVYKEERTAEIAVRTAAIGADHGGFELKEKLKPFLAELGLSVRDFGTNSTDAVDYPDFAAAVGRAVAGKNVDIGILVDGAGIGSAMAANKVAGVRAAACYSPELAKNAREHNGANVLTLGSGQTEFEDAKRILQAFVTTSLTEDRHKRRVAKIVSIENDHLR